ncbi:MAG: hypothetical protein K0S58_3600 [Nitrospira sp.]|nr:hypothetical protein [Nitrospira sp.]
MARQVREILKIAGILERVEIDHRMASALNQTTHHMRTDKTRATRDKNTHLKLHPIRPGLRHQLVGCE